MSGFEWVTYDEDAAPAPVYGPEPPDESFDDAEFEVALGGYSDGREASDAFCQRGHMGPKFLWWQCSVE